mmetsp:Transcript_6935/g.14478  ORF Transcript_6935/g.14478 Transcript_6935/m.14478 type:complete len:85 (+) Transcript_6935:1331-1585(+)
MADHSNLAHGIVVLNFFVSNLESHDSGVCAAAEARAATGGFFGAWKKAWRDGCERSSSRRNSLIKYSENGSCLCALTESVIQEG